MSSKAHQSSLALLLGGFVITPVQAEDFLTDLGDVLQYALPAAAGTATLFEGDPTFEGTKQWTKSTATSLGTMAAIKFVVDKTRPSNGGGSFPSGHTTGAFSGAAFIERRYGWKWGVPAYALAAVTGYSRIDADAHDVWDVIGGAALGTMGAYIFTEPFKIAGRQVSIRPSVSDGTYGLRFELLDDSAAWDQPSMSRTQRASFGSWFSGVGREANPWIGTDPTQTVSSFELRMEFHDQSQRLNRNETHINAYQPKLRADWAFRDNMMVGAEMGYVWNDLLPTSGDGFSDLELNYLWRFYESENAGPWCSRAGAFGVDVLVPTGNHSKGTGSGAWMVRPKISGAWSPISNTNIYPTLSYYQSFDTDQFVDETSVASFELKMEYKFDSGVYASWSPELLYDTDGSPLQDDLVANHAFEIGTPICNAGVIYARYELISNSLYNISPPGPSGRPRFYNDAISLGYRGQF